MTPFEGSEKTLRLWMRPGAPDLRRRDQGFWEKIVARCGGEILSTMTGADCTAHILSASSLFIWPDRLLLLTCGQTQLILSLQAIMAELGPMVGGFRYGRRQERWPTLQPSSFGEDLMTLQRAWPGQVLDARGLRGKAFVHQRQGCPPPSIQTHVLLMRDCTGPGRELFNNGAAKPCAIASLFGESRRGFQLDEYAFQPCGYSCNGLMGAQHLSIHVSPQNPTNCASVETGLLKPAASKLFKDMIRIFAPRQFESFVVEYTTKAKPSEQGRGLTSSADALLSSPIR